MVRDVSFRVAAFELSEDKCCWKGMFEYFYHTGEEFRQIADRVLAGIVHPP